VKLCSFIFFIGSSRQIGDSFNILADSEVSFFRISSRYPIIDLNRVGVLYNKSYAISQFSSAMPHLRAIARSVAFISCKLQRRSV
jgi:hypothetical protein